MKPDLSAESLAVAVDVVNELCYSDYDDYPYGWLGSPTWEMSSRSGGTRGDGEPYYSVKIRFESWRLQRENIGNIVDYLESVEEIKHHDYYFNDDQPFCIILEVPARDQEEEGGTR